MGSEYFGRRVKYKDRALYRVVFALEISSVRVWQAVAASSHILCSRGLHQPIYPQFYSMQVGLLYNIVLWCTRAIRSAGGAANRRQTAY
jgi:hypothetical protein